MNAGLKWKLTAGFVLVFLAGGVTGAFLGAAGLQHFQFSSEGHGVAAERMRERLQAELKLTPEQMTKISPIIDRAGAQLEQIRTETARRVHETFAQAHQEMSTSLTDEQRSKLEEMRERHQRWMHRTGGHEPPDKPPPQ